MSSETQNVQLINREIRRELGQLRPSNTTAASVYTPVANTTGIIETIVVCNQTASSVSYRIFLDANGTTFDETTALFFDVSLPANSTDVIETMVYINQVTGNLGVRTSANNALTFSVYGREIGP